MSTPSISSIKGTGYKQLQIPRLSPEQQQLFSQVFSSLSPNLGGAVSGLGQLAAGGTQEQWDQLEAPALRQFNQLQGQLASRFSGMGTGARRSSGFQNASSGAATDLAERLQSQRLGLQQNALQQLLGLYSGLMGTQTHEYGFLPKERPFWQQLLGGAAPGIGQALGTGGSLALMGI
jgi:hypothetical protein